MIIFRDCKIRLTSQNNLLVRNKINPQHQPKKFAICPMVSSVINYK